MTLTQAIEVMTAGNIAFGKLGDTWYQYKDEAGVLSRADLGSSTFLPATNDFAIDVIGTIAWSDSEPKSFAYALNAMEGDSTTIISPVMDTDDPMAGTVIQYKLAGGNLQFRYSDYSSPFTQWNVINSFYALALLSRVSNMFEVIEV